MITESSIYWILKLDDIRDVFTFGVGFFSLGSGFLLLVTFIVLATEDMRDGTRQRVLNAVAKYALVTAMLACPLCYVAKAFTPSTKQAAIIKVLPAIANHETIDELSSDAKDIYRMGVSAIKDSLAGGEKK